MSGVSFREKLALSCRRSDSFLCVGLDPAAERLPAGLEGEAGLEEFIRGIVEATREYAAAFKPNLAFFEAFGAGGRRVLGKIPSMAGEDTPVIIDAKLADIGNTSAQYARAFLGEGGFDAITVNPYMGTDSVAPFLEYRNRGVFLLCLTSNPGSADLQQAPMADGRPLWMRTAEKIKGWESEYGNAGAVVGATKAEDLDTVRAMLPDLPLLIPGVGAQGGDLESVLRRAVGPSRRPALINASRSINYAFASVGGDWREAAAAEAERLVLQMRAVLPSGGSAP